MEDTKEILQLVEGCLKGQRSAQNKLYLRYYNFAMGIALRYSVDREEALEIVNDGFMKVFDKLSQFNPDLSFMGWLRAIIVNSAIDYYRKSKRHKNNVSISHLNESIVENHILDNMAAEEIISYIQLLPTSYRVVFNLYVIEGYKHKEIANLMGITEGTCRSNLAVARAKLQAIILSQQNTNLKIHG